MFVVSTFNATHKQHQHVFFKGYLHVIFQPRVAKYIDTASDKIVDTGSFKTLFLTAL